MKLKVEEKFMNIRTEKILTAVLISMLMLSIPMVLVPKTRASPAVVRLYPDSPIVLGDATGTDVIGQEFSVAVVVEDIVGAYGADVHVHWNTTYFDYVSRNFTMPWNGTTLSDTGPSPYLGFLYSPGIPVEDTVDTGAGTYSAAYACMVANSFSGSGTFCSVKLKVKAQPASYDLPLGNYLNITMDIFYSKIVDKYAVTITPPIADGFVYLYSSGYPHARVVIDIHPDTLNLKSKGKWITCYIELPEGHNVNDIDVSTILLNGSIPAEMHPTGIGDYDDDGIPDLMVKFDRAAVISYILASVDMTALFEERFMTVTLTVTGHLNDDTPFQGSDTIKTLYTPRGVGKGRYIYAI